MGIKIEGTHGYPIEKQIRPWKDLAPEPISKLDSDAFTRVRCILMNGLENEAIRFSHACSRMNRDLQRPLAELRRIEQQQATTINWLMPADQSPLETTVAYEQTAIEITAAVAQQEPNAYLAQAYRFGLLEDFDHLYRYAALLDRLEGKDANQIIQSYSDILPGRPTLLQHRHPFDDLRNAYDRTKADPISKLNALTIVSSEFQTHSYYMNIGPLFADPLARALYAEIASIEEQHVTQYESIIDPTETWMEKWLLHEANEVYNYASCVEAESDSRVKAIWEMFLDFELGQLNLAMDLFKKIEQRDPMEILPATLPDPLPHKSHREFVRSVLRDEIFMSADGPLFIDRAAENERTLRYRQTVNSAGSPTEQIAAAYRWAPGGELSRRQVV